MLSAIVVLFFVVILMICLHLYARWYLLRARRRQMRRRSRRQNLVFYVDQAAASNPAQSRGLDAAVLKSLPVFVYSSAADTAAPELMECAVCLSEFEEKEAGRTLPKCGHSFHTECIDMWFHSHSTCPLCRSPVEPVPAVEMVELCDSTRDLEIGPSASVGGRKFRGDLGIEVPLRNFGEESSSAAAGAVPESPASQGFRSPMSRMLSFTRILSRDWRANNGYVLSPHTPIPTSCGGSMAAAAASEDTVDCDLERGPESSAEETRPGSSRVS
ncbi:unnamed protein product [Linum tenue]|uniref:RING-type E3 ubiquitin transferase n=4 Tax=Linum tenue TaxID=586396 RepID=A0AAV0P7T6_9ROSI|nr:unnamed protein product [Linum tenue]